LSVDKNLKFLKAATGFKWQTKAWRTEWNPLFRYRCSIKWTSSFGNLVWNVWQNPI